MKQSSFKPEFVDTIPEDIKEGLLYISTRFRTACHLCACGCGSRVVTPIKPAKWKFTYDGVTVSLSPSMGRWQLPCRSHYWICNSNVIWSRAFTEEEIEATLYRDKRDLHDYYAARQETSSTKPNEAPKHGLLSRLWRRISG